MRSAAARLAVAALLAAPWPAAESRADVDVAGARLSGQMEFGGRVITGDDWGTSGKYEEYRDQDPGLFGAGRFLVENRTQPYYVRGWLSDMGENDQGYRFEAGRWGLFELGLEYSELPHLYSNEARSLYSEHDAILDFPNAFQSALQATAASAANQSALLGRFLAVSPEEDLEFRLRTGRGRAEASLTEELDLFASYGIQERKGTKPFALGFGSPGGTFTSFAEPIDEKIHEVDAGARWSQDTWSLEAGYLGSFFENAYDRLIADNPLRSTDSPTAGPMRGRLTPAPDNSAHTFRLAGAMQIPVAFPARLAANVSYGRRFQDESFLCHTSNTEILRTPERCSATGTLLDLPEDSLDGDVRTLLSSLVLTARPVGPLNLTARYRLHDLDNRTPELSFPGHVVNDTTRADELRRSIANEYRRQNASLDADWRLTRWATLRSGYEFEQWDRSDDREVTRLHEQRPSVGLDLRPAPWAQIRASYEYGVRRSNGYEQFAYVEKSYDLAGLSHDERADVASGIEFPLLRKFDLADRTWNGVDLLAQLAPREDLSLTLTGGLAAADYDKTDYGLESDQRYSLGSEIAWSPFERIGVSTWYSFENIRYEQTSRWRPVSGSNPPVDSPLNDWSGLSKDQIHNFGLDLDLVLLPERLDASFGYGLQHAVGKTRADGRAGCVPTSGACVPVGTQADGGNAVNYPDLQDVMQTLYASLSYHVNEKFTVKASWVYEKFDLDDFTSEDLDPFEPTSNANSRDVFLGDQVGDYDAHLFALSLIYRF